MLPERRRVRRDPQIRKRLDHPEFEQLGQAQAESIAPTKLRGPSLRNQTIVA
jgi:hypothetical protein